jgi:formylglycine-generating enzyme required for sulfatase activity
VSKLTQKTGKTYRLPSEAEWEYACRGGEKYKYCGSDNADEVAWHSGNSEKRVHPVGGKKPNAFGLHDMSGNISEWVEDCVNGNYDGAPTDGSAWLVGNCQSRVIRGGAVYVPTAQSGAAYRRKANPTTSVESIGFRVARVIP